MALLGKIFGGARRRWIIAVSLLALVPIGAWAAMKYWSVRNVRMAERITADGMEAWKRGELHRAEISFETARALDPTTLRPVVLQARVMMRQRKTAPARALFREALSRCTGAERPGIAVAYLDALVSVGWWEERARLSLEELRRAGSDNVVLLAAAIESVRLARWSEPELAGVLGDGAGLGAAAQKLLLAQAQLNRSDLAAARATLHQLPASLPPVVSLLACRVWLRAGERDQARLALARADRQLDEIHISLGLVLLARDEPEQARLAVQAICRSGSLGTGTGSALEALLGELWEFPDRVVAEELARALRPSAKEIDTSLIGALWLYSSLADAADAKKLWAEQLGSRLNLWPINLQSTQLDEKIALFAINSLPLNRYLADGLVAAIPDSAPPRGTIAKPAAAEPAKI